MKKTQYKIMLGLFHKTLDIHNWEQSSKEWSKVLAENGWTNEEFDDYLVEDVYKRKGLKNEEV